MLLFLPLDGYLVFVTCLDDYLRRRQEASSVESAVLDFEADGRLVLILKNVLIEMSPQVIGRGRQKFKCHQEEKG